MSQSTFLLSNQENPWRATARKSTILSHIHAQAITDRWIAPIANSPKPPPERITMTLPVINSAKEVIIVAAGEGKVCYRHE